MRKFNKNHYHHGFTLNNFFLLCIIDVELKCKYRDTRVWPCYGVFLKKQEKN